MKLKRDRWGRPFVFVAIADFLRQRRWYKIYNCWWQIAGLDGGTIPIQCRLHGHEISYFPDSWDEEDPIFAVAHWECARSGCTYLDGQGYGREYGHV